MECIYCKGDTKVIGSARENSRVIRHRKCDSCGKDFYTEEKAHEKAYSTLRYEYNKLRDTRYK